MPVLSCRYAGESESAGRVAGPVGTRAEAAPVSADAASSNYKEYDRSVCLQVRWKARVQRKVSD